MMHFFRRPGFANTLTALALGSFLTTSCAKDQFGPAPSVAASPATAAAFSGEQLFQGIFLLEGPVAARLPYLQGFRAAIAKQQSASPALAQHRRHQAQALAATVQRLNPAYFAELKAAVASQNFDRIQAALQQGAALSEAATLAGLTAPADQKQFARTRQAVRQAFQSLDLTKYNFADQREVERFIADAKTQTAGLTADREDQQPQDLDVVFVTDIAFFLYFAVSVAVAWLLVVPGTEGGGNPQGRIANASKLENEQFVQQIAFNLN